MFVYMLSCACHVTGSSCLFVCLFFSLCLFALFFVCFLCLFSVCLHAIMCLSCDRKQLSSVAQRMTMNREHRKHQGGGLIPPRNYSPLTPIIQRYSSKEEDVSSVEPLNSGHSE